VQYNNYLKNYYLKKLNDLIITNSTLDRQISQLEDIDISVIQSLGDYNEHIRKCNQIIRSTFFCYFYIQRNNIIQQKLYREGISI
jgi:hypothetical protein